jgi:hypothetical protein
MYFVDMATVLEYSSYLVGSYGLGWGSGLLFYGFKKVVEAIT